MQNKDSQGKTERIFQQYLTREYEEERERIIIAVNFALKFNEKISCALFRLMFLIRTHVLIGNYACK